MADGTIDDTKLNGILADPRSRHAAAYIADLTADLARLAESHDLGILAYLLRMALDEAHQHSRNIPDG